MDATHASWPPLPGELAQTPDLLVERIVILQKGWNSGTQDKKDGTLEHRTKRMPPNAPQRALPNVLRCLGSLRISSLPKPSFPPP